MSGISLAKLQFAEVMRDDGTFSDVMRDDGTGIDTSLLPDCNLFNKRLIAQEAGFGQRADHWTARALCGSLFHLYPITAINSAGHRHVIGWATHTQSAQWGGQEYRKAARGRQLAGRRVTDVSGGSGENPAGNVVETIVAPQQGSEAPFAAEVWRLPVARPALRTAPPPATARGRRAPSAGRPADPAVAVAPRNDDPELEKEMRNQLHDDARRLLATTGPLDLAAIAAGLRLSTREGRVALARALRNTDGTIIGVPGEGEGRRLLYHVRAP